MPNATHWLYANENQARNVQTAFAKAAGLPKKGRQAGPGKGKRKGVPPRHSKGAYGWSENVIDVDRRRTAGPNRWAVQRAPECAPYEGQVVDIGPGPDITLPTGAEAVSVSGEWDPQPNVAQVAEGPRTRPTKGKNKR